MPSSERATRDGCLREPAARNVSAMRALLLASSFLCLVACGSGTKEPTPPTASSTPPEAPVANDGKGKPEEGEVCGNTRCKPPESCVTVVGMRQDVPPSHECYVKCGENDSCPSGMTCTMVYDGPGKIRSASH